MSSLKNQVLLEWLDVNGQPACTFWTTQDQTSGGAGAYAALASATQALCDASITHITFQQVLSLGGTPSSGDYHSVFDRAQFLARYETTNDAVQFALPGPKSSILLPGHEVVDMSNPDVVAWIAAMQAVLGDGSGHDLGQFVRGVRSRARGGS